jgi:hypothetical protein
MATVNETSRQLEVPYDNVASPGVASTANTLFRETYWSHGPRSLTRQETLEWAQRRASLLATVLRVRALRRRPQGWNGYDALPPDLAAIVYAEAWLRELHREVETASAPWLQPHVTSSAEGEVVLEWWNEPKKLTHYFSASEAGFVRSWGPDIVSEMDDGDAASTTCRQQLWNWLTT